MLSQAVLNKQEELLKERERLLDVKLGEQAELETQIEVLKKQADAKQAILNQINEGIEAQRRVLTEAERDYQSKIAELDSLIDEKMALVTSTQVKIGEKEGLLHKVIASRDEVNKDIKERKDYLSEQEKTVNETIAEWNAQLNDFKAQAKDASEEKTKILTEIVTLDQQKTTISHEIEDVEEKLASLDELYLTQLDEKKAELSRLDNQISEKNNALGSLSAQTEVLEQGLKTRESEIKLREIAYLKKDNDLRQKERFIESRLNMV